MNSVISAFKAKKNSSNNAAAVNNDKHNGGAVLHHHHHHLGGGGGGSNNSANNSKKKAAINAQDSNGYQYLRHIREIDTATKMLSPVVAADDLQLETDMRNFRPPSASVDVVDHAMSVRLTPTIGIKTSSAAAAADCNMNGAKSAATAVMLSMSTTAATENGNCDDNICERASSITTAAATTTPTSNGQAASPTPPPTTTTTSPQLDVDDDESEHSNAACTSSSSEYSNSTVVHSPTVAAAMQQQQQQLQHSQQQPSPAKSLSLSLSSNSSTSSSTSTSSSSSSSSSSATSASVAIYHNSGPSSCSSSTSCDVTTIAASPASSSTPTFSSLSTVASVSSATAAVASSTPASPTAVVVVVVADGTASSTSSNRVASDASTTAVDYVPAFLKSAPITLPIIMPNGSSGLASVPPHQLNGGNGTPANSAATTPKHARYSKPRLSLSRFINHSMPSVHGRPNLSVPGVTTNGGTATGSGNGAGTNPPKRISTHQRNLSLDFRSMGILLPPVSQVTNTRINLTQHHRNRSLDSALQRIPEVEVSSPNAESENTFCTPSILGTTMCSKIATTAASVTAALTTTTTPALTSSSSAATAAAAQSSFASSTGVGNVSTTEPTASAAAVTTIATGVGAVAGSEASELLPPAPPPLPHAVNPSVIVEPCPILRARPKSSENPAQRTAATIAIAGSVVSCNGSSNNNNSSGSSGSSNNSNSSGSKKREDLTSLGSDDSGIICGSESDQISLNRIRHSHESLDSGEMDAEEECIDMLETTSMDEEYGMLQSDLCFYQSPETDCQTLRPTRKKSQNQQNQHKEGDGGDAGKSTEDHDEEQELEEETVEALNERMRYREMNMSQAAISMEQRTDADSSNTPPQTQSSSEHIGSAETPTADVVDGAASAATPTTPAVTPTTATGQKTTPKSADPNSETTKNEVLFKSFFGATKNAIFRTAQSIIENHEKKNAAKNKNEDAAGGLAGSSGTATAGVTTPQDQVKSPTDISKKKEFFSLITSNSSKKAAAAKAAAASASATTTPAATPSAETPPASTSSTTECKSLHMEVEKYAEITERTLNLHLPGGAVAAVGISKSSSISSLNKLKVPGVVKCFIKTMPGGAAAMGDAAASAAALQKTEKGPSGLLRFFESPVFNIHFAVHYLFYSKEPGVLSFIGNKIFSFPDQEVDLYIPQLIVMYIQMDELAEVLDPYLTIRCRKSVDFSLKCLWLLEAYNYQVDSLGTSGRKSQLALMKEIFSKKERKILSKNDAVALVTASASASAIAPMSKKTHHRSQSDATVLLCDSRRYGFGGAGAGALSISNRLYAQPPYTTQTLPVTPAKLCLGDLTSGRAFDNCCTCFETVRGQVNGLLGQKTVCSCGAPKTAPQKEFMKALMNVGKNLTSLPSKAEKTSALRMFLNLINKNLPARVWLPLYSDIPHHVVRITEEKTAVLNSKDKTPYIIYVEVVEVPDIYSSSLIAKMMPSLRHTKSEEHLEGACGQLSHHASCSRTSSCSSSHGAGASCRRARKEKLISESSSLSLAAVEAVPAASATNVGDAAPPHTCNCNAAAAAAATTLSSLGALHLNEEDVWSQEDDEITAQYLNLRKISERDAISQMSLDSCDSRDQGIPVLFNIGDVRTRHCNNLTCENTKSFSNDPEDPSAAALKEPWDEKEKQIRESSPYGHLSNWRLLSAIVKCGDDLRQELMATQLLQMFKIIWQEENVDLWVRPYKIVCLSGDSGLIEPILNTVSLHQIKKNSNKSLRDYFIDEYGAADGAGFRIAQKNFVQSCAAYCLISYLLQVKDRHNGNILLHSDGHIIHIDFGFILSISPKNLGFEQSPFKLTPEFVDVMGGTSTEHWREFNRLLLVGMMSARKHMDRIINFVEIMRSNAQLPCFKNGCSGTVQNLRKRFHMNLTEQEMERKVEQLVQDSLKSLSTKLYDGYQYYTNGIL